ncbi:DUF4350 domain-containing protein [Nodosilinea sp. LEGE 07088]|uniref:DUF4350 domain-containing protein n=1 Tax=Nodosilinea sp. LEGE 07088 TaxID=2777968 RepID=UPI001D140D86|nr:DUF4350 domain-containing protein [Nodosilinea sp. LEGE 07088]
MRSLPLTRRNLILAALALALLLGLMLLSAPATSRLESGSTWHRGPAGYSAWYESLEQQGVTVQRWQRPVEDLLNRLYEAEESTVTLIQNPSAISETLLVVLPEFIDESELPALLPWMPQWIDAGYRLVVLGVKTPATAAPFSQMLTSEAGPVEIKTRRRHPRSDMEIALADEYGAVVWQQAFALGEFVAVATPHLAANAYQNQPGNFALLTKLVAGTGRRVWVDEYLHGYRDEEAIAAEIGSDSWLSYLARTPLLILLAQALVVTLVALLALNHRLGQRLTLQPPRVDNSRAYIQALAGVLHKAGSHDFVVQTLSQDERIQLQKSLGLGGKTLPLEQLQAAWDQQNGRSTTDLDALLNPPVPKTESQLRDWLKRVQSLHYPEDTIGDTNRA